MTNPPSNEQTLSGLQWDNDNLRKLTLKMAADFDIEAEAARLKYARLLGLAQAAMRQSLDRQGCGCESCMAVRALREEVNK